MYTIGDWVRVNSTRDPKREAFVGEDGRVTFGQAAERAWSLARGLAARDARVGDVVGVLAKNTVFNAEAFLGITTAGAVYAAYNWRWAAEELAQGIVTSGARLVLVEPELEPLLDDALARVAADGAAIERPAVLRPAEVDALRRGTGAYDAGVTPEDPACLIFTGGSTGTAKAVALAHRSATVTALHENLDVDMAREPGDRGLVVTPLFHVAGLFCGMFTHFAAGRTSVLATQFDEASFAEAVEREGVTNSFMVPNMLRRLLKAGVFDAPGVRRTFRAMHTGAGLLRMPDKERYFDAVPGGTLYFRYGLTEAGPMVTRLQSADMLRPEVDGSIGQEYTFSRVRLRDPETGLEVAPGELGEICVRGPGVMLGYHGRPDATADAFADGWLRTGDLATRDDDGYVFFKDRLKEMIKTGGENVYSAEVEQALYLHPAVQEAVVVGVPNDEWGEEVRAVVCFRSGAEPDAQQLRDHLRAHLAGYKIPKVFVTLAAEELPRTGAGKLVKTRLKQQLGW